MDKKDILEKSRKENNNRDLYEEEVLKGSKITAADFAIITAFVLFVIELGFGRGVNFGICTVLLSASAGKHATKAIRLKSRRDMWFAVVYGIVGLISFVLYMAELISTSAG